MERLLWARLKPQFVRLWGSSGLLGQPLLGKPAAATVLLANWMGAHLSELHAVLDSPRRSKMKAVFRLTRLG